MTDQIPPEESERREEAPLVGGKEVSALQDDSDRFVDDQDGLEFQIAIDSMAAGNLKPLKYYLARVEGLDPARVSLRSTPYDISKDGMPGSKLTFVGELDSIGDPNAGLSGARAKPPPTVRLFCPEELYEYQPLDPALSQMRLLRLGPKDKVGVIHTLELQVFDLSKVPQFYALSYVWGQPNRIMPLPCNDGRIMLTQNLYRAIHQTFTRYSDIWLWADGICINQNDLIERGHQVSMMGEIYRQAALVIAHTGHHSYRMGPEDVDAVSSRGLEITKAGETVGIEDLQLRDTSRINDNNVEEVLIEPGGHDEEEDVSLLDTSQSAISLMNYLTRIWARDDDYSLVEDKGWENRKVPDLQGRNEKIWTRLFGFWNEDWFYRSWVLQEAVLGKKVILLVDDAACSLDFVMKFWELAKKHDTPEFLKRGPLADEYNRILHLSPVSSMKALRDFKHRKESEDTKQPETKSDLLSLLSLSRVNLASDPRDKVYSLLGLAEGDSLADSITPDYSEANSTAVLYRTIAAAHIEEGLGTELLQYAGIDHKVPNLPSWAPDWSHQPRSNMYTGLYSCSGPSIPSLFLSKDDPNMLLVRGAIIDTICWNGMPWRYYSTDRGQEKFARFKESPDTVFPPFTDEDGRCLIRTMAKNIGAEYCSKFAPSEDFITALGRTLCMDCTWRGERTQSDSSFLEGFKAFERLYEKAPEGNITQDTKNVHSSGIFDWVWDFGEEESMLRKQSWPFEVAFQEAHKGRRSCATKEGYMCTAPYNTERGDVVAILEGFRTPFVLRKSGDNWKLVGDCYVHCIMDGELVVPLRDCEVRRNEIAINANGEPFALLTSSGFAKFQDFGII